MIWKVQLKQHLKVWVPGRNIVFTAIANSFAESDGCRNYNSWLGS